MMSVSKTIRLKINSLKKGKPFRSSDFLGLGSRAALDQALWRLVKAGEIVRVRNGVFVKPEKNPYVGEILPSAEEMARFFAKQSGSKVEVGGAEAARRFGFSTQVPSRPVFWTDGPNRKCNVGNLEVRLKHVPKRKVAFAGRPAGTALSALWYLGKEEVAPETFEKIEHRLPPEEFETLTSKPEIMPGWMRSALTNYKAECQVA